MGPRKLPAEQRQLRALVRGRVQGVGFRYFVQREAAARGIAGWVRNLASGDVEVTARGAPDALQAFVERLWEGPALARVEHVVLDSQAPDPSLLGFGLKPTGW
jgi:acylphosphatase